MLKPIIFMIIMLIIAFIGPFMMQGGSLQDLMSNPLSLFATPDDDKDKQELSNVSSSQTFYKWQDENGRWHYADREFAAAGSEKVSVNPEANLIQGLHSKKDEEEEKDEEKAESFASKVTMLPVSVKPEKVKEMFEDAEEIQDLPEERMKQLEEILNGGSPEK